MMEPMFKLIVAEPEDTPPIRVYQDYYHLREPPFAITPDPDFLFSANSHKQVLEKINYAIDGRMGFVLLTGEVGTGKTTICRTLLDQLSGRAETVYLINPSVSAHELLFNILDDMGVCTAPQASKKNLIDQLNRYLLSLAPENPFVVIIDDAQTMSLETLEDLRLLSNLETDKRKLIQVVLSGQPELLDMLSDKRLRQLKQRIAVHCRLDPLGDREIAEYISQRLLVAGNQGRVAFSASATRLIHEASDGIPRLINNICDYSLTAGYVSDVQTIGTQHVKQALSEVQRFNGKIPSKAPDLMRFAWPKAFFLLMAVGAVIFSLRPVTAVVTSIGPVNDPASMVALPKTLPVGPSLAGEQSNPTRTGEIGTVQQHQQPAPFALQLGSFRSLARAERSAADFGSNGVPAMWQKVGDGSWYRIVAGEFNNWEQAAQYKQKHGLHDALIINAPLAIKVLLKQPGLPQPEMLRALRASGHDGLMKPGPGGDIEIYTGYFSSLEDARVVAERINAGNRFLAQVVSRMIAQPLQE
jgi:general secretion pathway protein A